MKAKRIIENLTVIMLLCASALSQSPASEMKHFNIDGLSFDYPADWILTDRSNPQAQHLVLTHARSSALIMVIAHRDLVSSSEQLAAVRDSVTIPFVQNVAQKFGLKETPLWRNSLCAEVGEYRALGFILHGQLGKEPSTGEIYTLAPGRRFVNMVYIRSDKDNNQGHPAWQAVRDSLKVVEASSANSDAKVEDILGSGVLNGTARELPKPSYPGDARKAGVGGRVTVKVKIDEVGKVYSAEIISGPIPLRLVCKQAALQARFSPTVVCGVPVKVIGIIRYDFGS